MPGISELARIEEEEQLSFDFPGDPVGDAVEEFRTIFEPPANPDFWLGLVREEEKEVAEAMANLLKEIVDLEWVTEGYDQTGGDLSALKPRLPWWMVNVFSAIPREVFLEALKRVRESNLSKLGPNGEVLRRPEDGKVLKGPNYKPADLSDLTIIND